MALQKLGAGYLLMLLLICKGCHSQQPACGRVTTRTRIIGGHDALPGSWPWQIALTDSGSFFCGGSLITDHWVLTAAHCFTSYDLSVIQVHLGVHNLTGFNPNGVTRTIEQVIVHPLYNIIIPFDNDVCLLKLSAPVNFTDFISPVCLAADGSTFYDELSSWVTGFGVTDSGSIASILQEVNVPIVGENACTCYLQDFATITGNMICAGKLAGGKDSCQGDSGGPLVVLNDNNMWVQAGVVSFGDRCALPLRPGVYARVSQYQSWISAMVTGMAPGFVTYSSPGFNLDSMFICPTSLPTPIPITYTTDGSIFGSGENLKPTMLLTTLFVLVPFYHVFVGGGEM